eukprot:1514321-Amphidinium_carterae.1
MARRSVECEHGSLWIDFSSQLLRNSTSMLPVGITGPFNRYHISFCPGWKIISGGGPKKANCIRKAGVDRGPMERVTISTTGMPLWFLELGIQPLVHAVVSRNVNLALRATLAQNVQQDGPMRHVMAQLNCEHVLEALE